MKTVFWAVCLSTAVLSWGDDNRSKELEKWLRFQYTHNEKDSREVTAFIKKLRQRIERLENEVKSLRRDLRDQNGTVNTLLQNPPCRCEERKKHVDDRASVSGLSSDGREGGLERGGSDGGNKMQTTRFRPALFKTLSETEIYDTPEGEAVRSVPKGFKFTAYRRQGDWICISGHFPHGRWEDIDRELWVREQDVAKIR